MDIPVPPCTSISGAVTITLSPRMLIIYGFSSASLLNKINCAFVMPAAIGALNVIPMVVDPPAGTDVPAPVVIGNTVLFVVNVGLTVKAVVPVFCIVKRCSAEDVPAGI